MRLLFVGSLLPQGRPATGFDIATKALADGLERAGALVTVMGYRAPGAPPAEGARTVDLGPVELENAGAGRRRKGGWVLRALAAGLPVSAAKLALLADAELRRRVAGAGPFDALVLNSIQMPTAYPFLLKGPPVLYVAHNVEHASARQNAANASRFAERLLYRREARLLEAAEARACAAAARVAAFTQADLSGLGIEAARGLVLPLTLGRPPVPDDGTRTHDVGLIGTWSWAPNRVGLDWFAREVAPRLPPDISVAVAGRFDGPPPPAPGTVRFLGRVPDAGAFVRASRVLALATKGGTGIQLKTIEALEEGMPAAATPEALRGISRVPANVRAAGDPQAFADALAGLVRAERAGQAIREDGAGFARDQRAGLDAALTEALRALAPGACGRASRARPAGSARAAPAATPAGALPPVAGASAGASR